MTRIQIYLDDDQRRALRAIAADTDTNVSELVREAIDRLLAEKFVNGDFGRRLQAIRARIRAKIGEVNGKAVAEALKNIREEDHAHA